ncbi:MAG: DUF2911 domain-containing protein [Bacteroidota bacterium]
MKITYYLFTAVLFAFGYACEPATEDTNEEESTEMTAEESASTDTEEASEAAMEVAAPSGENYSTAILETDIPSPRKEMTGTIGDVNVTVNYGSPSVKGRTIWGDLEPYDEVWRTGANKATTIEFSKDVTVEGEALAAGKYALFTIPREGDWTVIFSKKSDQFGDYNYDEADDALRVDVSPTTLSESVEQMEFVIEGNQVMFHWDKMGVPFSVEG